MESRQSVSTALELPSYPTSENQHPSLFSDTIGQSRSTSIPSVSSDHPQLNETQSPDSIPPDGGYGWVAVVGGCIVSWWMIGIPYSWGIVQSALIARSVSTPAVLSFVGSLAACLLAALAIINSKIMRSLGSRGTGMMGMTFMGVANLISSFTFTNIGALFAASGVIMGIGISLSFAPVSVISSQYFDRKKGLANGIIFAAGGLGGAAISYGLDALIQNVGIGWALRIMALLTLATGVPAAYLIKERIPYKSTGFIDWNLFKSPTFIAIFLAGAIATFPLFVPPFFIPLYSKSIGLSSNIGAALVAGFNFSSALGRILCGLLCDRIGAINVLLLSLVLTGLSNLVIWPFSTTLAPLIPFVILNGMANGGFFSTMPTVVGSVFGPSKVSIAMGMSVTGWAGGYLMGSPIAGYLLDAYGGSDSGFRAYRPAMYYAGSLALAAAGIVAMIRFHLNRNILAKL
ncbi:hypothetical protein FSST1_006603 [Fusarium sambucinum]